MCDVLSASEMRGIRYCRGRACCSLHHVSLVAQLTSWSRSRDQLFALPYSRKHRVLRHIAPFAAEIIFLCYCDWFNNQPDEQFTTLLMAIPDLDIQVEEHAKIALPGMTCASWRRHMQRASGSCFYKITLAEQFRSALIARSPACKALCFDDCL
jgi:hypothetical protein